MSRNSVYPAVRPAVSSSSGTVRLPIFISATVDTDGGGGSSWVLRFNKPVSIAAGYANGNFSSTNPTANLSITGGSGTNQWSMASIEPNEFGDAPLLQFNGLGVEDADGNNLAAFSDKPVTNITPDPNAPPPGFDYMRNSDGEIMLDAFGNPMYSPIS